MSNKKPTIQLETRVALDTLALQLTEQLNRAALRKLIREIDSFVADYDFTKQLRDYFVKEIAIEDAEAAIRDQNTTTKKEASSS
jgi:hypothetical protein